ncbi:organic hydroperoxide resistance protein [Phaeobacter sp. HF9A]|uniref:organic hydroperoxide resistance protein n=1 Tax=Phaeobacter sp. HF9A TaxID=2721561 RepID=UPI0014314EC7|nr:organic hydroperoxide resistance protein [Phaeobacter sp. HF9A]NIZ12065.1 organic hydroperoxide resistance protein [Phaeobacter sp. HF9A]
MTDKLVYTATVTAQGGRDGRVTSDDGNLDVALVVPKAFGGPGGAGTNPEQLFAAGYSACFLSALKLTARLEKVTLEHEPGIEAQVGVLSTEDGYKLAATLKVSMPGLDKDMAEKLVAGAHERCPYSRATRGNIDVTLEVV